MTRTLSAFGAAAIVALGASLYAQTQAPTINFDSTPDLLRTPLDTFVGEVAGDVPSYVRAALVRVTLHRRSSSLRSRSMAWARHRPVHLGGRFSWNARMPSR